MDADKVIVNLILTDNGGESAFIAALAEAVVQDVLDSRAFDNVNTYNYDERNADTQDDNADGDSTAVYALDRQGPTCGLEAA